MIKLIGIALILISTAATGAAMVGGVHATLDQTRALQQLLQLMRSEIQYHLTPLPEIFAAASKTISGPVGVLCENIAASMLDGQPQTVYFAVKSAMDKTDRLSVSRAAQGAFLDLARSLGRYDLDSQLCAIDYCLERLGTILATLEAEKSARCRSYGAVCACAGVCFLIIVV